MVLEGGVEKPRMPLEAERLTKAMMVGHAKGEMPLEMRLMPLEPVVQSTAAAEREFTTGKGWRRGHHHHQECDEQQPVMFRHDPSPLGCWSLHRSAMLALIDARSNRPNSMPPLVAQIAGTPACSAWMIYATA
jgi:hypothetical protein